MLQTKTHWIFIPTECLNEQKKLEQDEKCNYDVKSHLLSDCIVCPVELTLKQHFLTIENERKLISKRFTFEKLNLMFFWGGTNDSIESGDNLERNLISHCKLVCVFKRESERDYEIGKYCCTSADGEKERVGYVCALVISYFLSLPKKTILINNQIKIITSGLC